MDKHPSTAVEVSSVVQRTEGLIKAKGLCGFFPFRTSMTKTFRRTPTCGAASPTPSAEYIVSKRSSTSASRLLSNAVTGLHGVVRMSFEIVSIGLIIVSPPEKYSRDRPAPDFSEAGVQEGNDKPTSNVD